jgi:hypothetical protein
MNVDVCHGMDMESCNVAAYELELVNVNQFPVKAYDFSKQALNASGFVCLVFGTIEFKSNQINNRCIKTWM